MQTITYQENDRKVLNKTEKKLKVGESIFFILRKDIEKNQKSKNQKRKKNIEKYIESLAICKTGLQEPTQ